MTTPKQRRRGSTLRSLADQAPAEAPPAPQPENEEERVRMTVYLPLSHWEVVEAVALKRKKARGGRGHASATKVIADLVAEQIEALRAEAER